MGQALIPLLVGGATAVATSALAPTPSAPAMQTQAQQNAPTQKERQTSEVTSGLDQRELQRKRLASSRGYGSTLLAGGQNQQGKTLLGQ